MRAPVDINTRYASIAVEQWKKFDSEIYITVNDNKRRISGASQLGILSLCIKHGDLINFILINDDETIIEKEMNKITELIKSFERR